MAAPEFADRTIEPPTSGWSPDEAYRWLYDIWQRTGGFESIIPDLTGLVASVAELNTLVGINTSTTVQAQLNSKVNIADIGTMAAQDADNVNITGGALTDVIITDSDVSGDLRITVGTSTSIAKTAASLNSNVTAVSNVSTGESNLMSYSLLANMLGNNGDYIEIEAYGTFAANGNNKRIRAYFGSTVIFDTTTVAANAGSWWIKAHIAREALADQQSIASIISSNALITASATFTNPSEDLGDIVVVKITGQGGASNDITQEGFSVKWFAGA